jgi:hypothetical protein
MLRALCSLVVLSGMLLACGAQSTTESQALPSVTAPTATVVPTATQAPQTPEELAIAVVVALANQDVAGLDKLVADVMPSRESTQANLLRQWNIIVQPNIPNDSQVKGPFQRAEIVSRTQQGVTEVLRVRAVCRDGYAGMDITMQIIEGRYQVVYMQPAPEWTVVP